MPNLPLIEAPPVDYGPHESAMARYREDGTRRALALGNRGPIRLDASASSPTSNATWPTCSCVRR